MRKNDTIRYDIVYLTCSEKLTVNQLSIPHAVAHGMNKNVTEKLKINWWPWYPCGRLSWLPVSFLLHVKHTLSYRIKKNWVIYNFCYWLLLCSNTQRVIVVCFILSSKFAKSPKIVCRLGLCPNPLGELTALPKTALEKFENPKMLPNFHVERDN